MLSKKNIFVALIIVLVIIFITILTITSNNRRTLNIETDFTPVSFNLDDDKTNIKEKKTSINLKSHIYNYRAVANVEGKKVVYSGKINLLTDKESTVRLKFNIFSKNNILNIICQNFKKSCPFKMGDLRVEYLEDYSWIVVSIKSNGLEDAKAVIKNSNGQLDLIDGPATDIETGGFYPESVERYIKNAQ